MRIGLVGSTKWRSGQVLTGDSNFNHTATPQSDLGTWRFVFDWTGCIFRFDPQPCMESETGCHPALPEDCATSLHDLRDRSKTTAVSFSTFVSGRLERFLRRCSGARNINPKLRHSDSGNLPGRLDPAQGELKKNRIVHRFRRSTQAKRLPSA